MLVLQELGRPVLGRPLHGGLPRDGMKRCVANAPDGCVHYERVPGVDDDGWAPVRLVRQRSPERRAVEPDEDVIALAQRLDHALAAGPGKSRPGP